MIRAHLLILSWSIPAGIGLVIGGLTCIGVLSAVESAWKHFFGPSKKEEK